MARSPAGRKRASGRRGEATALLAAAHAVIGRGAFARTAAAVLDAFRNLLGAGGGFVALCTASGEDLELVTRAPGDASPAAAHALPAPLRVLAARVAQAGQPLHLETASRPAAGTPKRGDRAVARYALVAPILIGDDVAGVLGLFDKAKGFSAADARLAEVFAELAAVALVKSRTVNSLEQDRESLERDLRAGAERLQLAESQFRTLVENLPDVIARFDPALRHVYVSPSVERVTGRPAADFLGRTNREMGLAPELDQVWDAALHRVFASGEPERFEFAIPAVDGVRHFDCRLVPESETAGRVDSVLTVARDVTDRWLAFEAEQHARYVAESLREATVVLTRSLDRESVLVTLLDRLRRMVPFDRARVMLVEGASRLSVRAVYDGERALPLPADARPELDVAAHPIVDRILATGTAVRIPDVRAHPGWSLPRERPPDASWMGVPLFARGSVAGLFSLSKREADYFREEHVKLAEALSSQASVAVENAVLFEQMQASSARLSALTRRLVDAQESERRHIALELHDEAGQALVSLRLGLRLLEKEVVAGGGAAGRVAELVATTDGVIDVLHRLAADLRPASLDHLGLDAALRQFARSAAAKFALPVHFKARGFTSERLPQAVETALYRVVQEAMTNVVRHARATRVDLMVERRDDRVVVMVEDDGVGFDTAEEQGGEHFGLLGMRERADALGGKLIVESAPGKGTTIVVEVPSADSHPDR